MGGMGTRSIHRPGSGRDLTSASMVSIGASFSSLRTGIQTVRISPLRFILSALAEKVNGIVKNLRKNVRQRRTKGAKKPGFSERISSNPDKVYLYDGHVALVQRQIAQRGILLKASGGREETRGIRTMPPTTRAIPCTRFPKKEPMAASMPKRSASVRK